MKLDHLPENPRFSTRRFFPRLVYGSDRGRVFLLCLEEGQGLPVRPDPEEVLCCVIEGTVKISVGEQTFTAAAGDFVAAAPGEARGIEAQTRAIVLWIHMAAGRESNG
jgi:quercetin dioxygenase-like cupin family protein